MKIAIAVPIRPGVTSGNSVTGHRWQNQLVELGHEVVLVPVAEDGETESAVPADADLVVALHARRAAAAVVAAKKQNPSRPVVVALAGTDLYSDLPESQVAIASIDAADHLVVLQEQAIEQLASIHPKYAARASVVHQSVELAIPVRNVDPHYFTVVVLAHLRDVKDPLLAAKAAALMPDSSRLRVLHAGSAHNADWQSQAEAEMAANSRYQWLGGLESSEASDLLASADLLACTSLLEGGANVVTEAIALGIGVAGTEIGGNRGMLGPDHRGLVPVGDFEALARLLHKLETDENEMSSLVAVSLERQWMTKPENERRQWQAVLDKLS